MIPFLVALETAALVAVAALLWRRAVADGPRRGARVALLAALVLAELAALGGFLRILLGGATGTAAFRHVPGLVFVTQAARAALLLSALALWLGLVRQELRGRGSVALVAGALAALAWGGGALAFLAFLLLAFRFNRFKWMETLGGWRRAGALAAGLPLLLLLSALPYITLDGNRVHTLIQPVGNPWPPPLLMGDVPDALRIELQVARPLDRVVQAMTDLFRAQLAALILKLLVMPVRLSGISLKRRFLVNYVLVRGVPSFLSAVALAVVGYLAFGLQVASGVRGELERTLTRAATVATAVAEGAGPNDAARGWLGPDGARAEIGTRRAEGGASDSAFTGMVEQGGRLFLAARRTAPGAARSAEVRVPLDSLHLERLKQISGVELALVIRPTTHVGPTTLRFSGDSAWTGSSASVRTTPEDGRRRYFLARSYLAAGEWWAPERRGEAGAVELALSTAPRQLVIKLARSLGWLGSNLVPLALILLVLALMGVAESAAVRSGRSIVDAILEEVGVLKEAATRFGRGDLAHRLPVRGKDELSALAGSFNEMAASLERQREELAQKERLEEELAVARSIQQRLLPQSAPRLPGLGVAGVSLPSREVGGDLFHYAVLEGGRLGLAVGDVSGKSVPAALLMSNVISALRAEALHGSAPDESLSRMNRLIAEQVETGRFVTLCYATIDPDGAVRYASAGHDPPLRVTRDGGVQRLDAGGVPLGVLAGARYELATSRLEAGEVLVLYSDGVTEAEARRAGNAGQASGPDDRADRELFGMERLVQTVRGLRARPAEEILRGILDAVQRFTAGTEQADDITVVVVKREG